ncbi:MAG: branched-chain amino acid ABC transporter permease [Desulfuromonadales bacterium]|nr:branched-chain amino acid ABC transporter permease [Desulfuromonadales bacterium]
MSDLARSEPSTTWRVKVENRSILCLLGLVGVLALVPFYADEGLMRLGVEVFTLLTMAQMWNLLAGYTGFVSVGQQVFVGIGAYGMALVALKAGINPFVAVAFGGLIAGLVGTLAAPILFHLRGPYFAIGTWVLAELFRIFISNNEWFGGGSGLTLARAVQGVPREWRTKIMFWLALALVAGAILLVLCLLRSRFGLAIRTVRDNEASAESVGVNVLRVKLTVFIVAAFVTGYAGAINYLNSMFINVNAAFSVDWSALMIFVVVIGGIGTIEGPIIGIIIYFILREYLSDYGTWYMITLGTVAIGVMLLVPDGIWGLIAKKFNIRLFNTRSRLDVFSSEDHIISANAKGGNNDQPS